MAVNFECIVYEKKQTIGVIRLNRPRVLNAMNRRLWLDFEAALADAGGDPGIRVVVITGEGRAFSTGADLKDSRDRTIEDYRTYLESLQQASLRLIRFEKPVIAAVNGYAIGSGFELALACDIRIAAEEARMGLTEATVASSVTGGALRLIQDLVGPGKAKELLFTGELIDGREAERIGLVNRAVPADQLMETALAMAEAIGKNAPLSLNLIKKGLYMARGEASMDALMAFEIEACLACVSAKERKTSLDTFEKRKK
jgi:enoyl-CoA hydratase